MKLTRLRLVGFKSFVEPTDFMIDVGLTGIVGPNGCGKSNLVEALRWAMGESSHKAMRAADMDDVIFSGSSGSTTRPARNTAEVTLFLDNKERTAPPHFNDQDTLEVSRRIERDSGSTYRINHREVRARDVQILFADASSGARSPALVHQGRIGEIIQAKPAQRRRVLEEAAGVAGLHARRHEAELRLNAADANLARLEDVVAQIAAQIDALKRQARQAARYRAVAAGIRKAEAQLCHLRCIAADAEVAEAGRANDLSVRLVAEATAAEAEAATRQATAAAALPSLREAEAMAAAALQRLNLARDTLDREEARARDRIAELDRRLIQLGGDIERERRLAADAEAALKRLSEEEETLTREGAQGVEERIGVAERVAAAEAALAAAEKAFSELTVQHADLTARKNQLDRATREHSERLTRLEHEIAEVEAERGVLERDGAERGDLATLAAAVEAAQAAVEDAEAQALRAEAALSSARQGHDAAKGPHDQAERRAHRLETEVRTLARLLDVETQKLWPPAIDLLTVDKGFEAALGAALGDDLDAPIDPAAPVRWTGAAIDPTDPALPAGAERLSRYVTAPPELARRLAQIGVIERGDAVRLAAELKPGQRLVSREGDLWRWDGFAAAAHAPTAAARRLAQKNRLADLEAELIPTRADAEGRRAAVEQAAREVADAVAAEADARARRRELQSAADAARERHTAAEREASRITAKLSALSEAKVRLAASRDEAAALQRETSDALAALPPTAGLEGEIAEIRLDVTAKRAALAEVRGEAQALAREAELRERRLGAIADEATRWSDRTESARSQIETLEARHGESESERRTLDDAPAAFAEKRAALIDELAAAEARRRAAADDLAAKETALAEADRAARAALEATGSARAEAARAEERLESARRHRVDIAHEIQELLDVAPEAVAALAGIEPDAALPDLAETEAELDKLRRDRERLGAVNLRAEEELREVEAQHASLTAERDDLIEAIKRLRQGIQNLNREARERLNASFEVVNRHFQELFTSLFGGGTAELQLIESDDPLEAGLDILAKPPGKKPQTLSLLSGGEQALTAMALIFAVFLTNPAPICVLDEVDAPLDDANVERFCGLLDEMTRKTDTRFVIITHNPITMARMNRLFGVTMAERGVSQLVSVDLETAARIREAG
ncbi:MAG TPA: chromosome segregation protein SMC [Xanthobacteraceae bacterium]|nr:chromosome segregation protein SMC [Xanthobacteraceae bacterium]